ncbi:hypothetical protein KC19_4G124000 [Ceratodon purpureus]|uniref:RRM domain-containing protein n=1 Tax=Ceratodon purpureus TaxID=3225 RepID=A0A8T0IA26_CERPU|nr:hypothetical protein KC19_4G124000 [Ceratodon purpureus]
MERNSGDHGMNLGSRKLVVLGIPWDIDTEGLRQYMLKFGELDDVIVMKDRSTGRSRGFGYVTFAAVEDAKKAVSTQHSLNGRMLEVKVATPKEEMKPPAKKITRVFVARIPPSVTDENFRSYFEKYGTLTDAYMPKDQGSKAHRGIGFVTFENPESVDRLMNETHELGGSTIAVDRATPKEDGNKSWGRGFHGGNSNSGSNAGSGAYGAYGVYTAARFGGFGGGFGAYDYAGSGLGNDLGPSGGLSSAYGGGNSWPPAPPGGGYGGPGLGIPGGGSGSYGSGGPPVPPLRGLGTKIFVGRLPPEANAEDLRRYFNNFGRISDVYVPKDAKKTSHRGFGFVTFSDEGAAERVALRSHEILGHQIAVDRAAPQDEMSNISYMNSVGSLGSLSQGAGGPMRGSNAPLQGSGYGSLSCNLDSSGWGGYGGVGGFSFQTPDSGLRTPDSRSSRSEPRYRPY